MPAEGAHRAQGETRVLTSAAHVSLQGGPPGGGHQGGGRAVSAQGHQRSLARSEGAQGWLVGSMCHPWYSRRCLMRGCPRAVTYPHAGGDAAWDPRGTHWGW